MAIRFHLRKHIESKCPLPLSQQPYTFSVLSQLNLIYIILLSALTSFLVLYQTATSLQTFPTKTTVCLWLLPIRTIHVLSIYFYLVSHLNSIFHVSTVLVDLGIFPVSVSRSYSDTPQSVGLFLSSDGPVADTSAWQHTTFTRDNHASSGIRTNNSS